MNRIHCDLLHLAYSKCAKLKDLDDRIPVIDDIKQAVTSQVDSWWAPNWLARKLHSGHEVAILGKHLKYTHVGSLIKVTKINSILYIRTATAHFALSVIIASSLWNLFFLLTTVTDSISLLIFQFICNVTHSIPPHLTFADLNLIILLGKQFTQHYLAGKMLKEFCPPFSYAPEPFSLATPWKPTTQFWLIMRLWLWPDCVPAPCGSCCRQPPSFPCCPPPHLLVHSSPRDACLSAPASSAAPPSGWSGTDSSVLNIHPVNSKHNTQRCTF